MLTIRIPAFLLLASLLALSHGEIIGDTCTIEPQTPCPTDSTCVELEGTFTCTCNSGYVAKDDNTVCLKEASALEESCTENKQCSNPFPNSECKDSKCSCVANWVENSLKDGCLKILSNFNEECLKTSQCANLGSAICDSTTDKCACADDSVMNSANNKCILGALDLGTNCTGEANVCTTIENAECNADNKCACKSSFVVSLSGDKCLAVTGDTLGGACEESQQCSVKLPNSVCIAEKCGCATNHVAALDAKSCLVYSDFGEQCKENSQCTAETEGEVSCVPGVDDTFTCQCKTNNHFVSEKCWVDRKLGETCSNKNECILSDGKTELVDCRETKCACIDTYVADLNANICNSSGQNAVIIALLACTAVFAKLF